MTMTMALPMTMTNGDDDDADDDDNDSDSDNDNDGDVYDDSCIQEWKRNSVHAVQCSLHGADPCECSRIHQKGFSRRRGERTRKQYLHSSRRRQRQHSSTAPASSALVA